MLLVSMPMAKESQKAPYETNAVPPSVFLAPNSRIPAINCARPPKAKARPRKVASVAGRIPALTRLRRRVVTAKPLKPEVRD